jgi:hypothetical protein
MLLVVNSHQHLPDLKMPFGAAKTSDFFPPRTRFLAVVKFFLNFLRLYNHILKKYTETFTASVQSASKITTFQLSSTIEQFIKIWQRHF